MHPFSAEKGCRRANVSLVRPSREAAVVLAIFANPPHHVVFVERAAHLRDHPGQIGLPGGSVDDADGGDHARAALRELKEELGVPPARVTLLGRLPVLRQRINTFVVTPFIGTLAPGTKLTIDANETAAVFTVPLAEIIAPGAIREGIEVVGDRRVETLQFDYDRLHVWGLTARILHAFVAEWRTRDSALREGVEAALL